MKKILIIEDDQFIRENVSEVLELSGYTVYSAVNGKEGLNLAIEILPDLIICDIMMPVMDGYEVRANLIENKKTKIIPFLFLTAKAELKEMRRGMSLGADDYITKPFEIKDLLKSVQLRFEKIEEITEAFGIESSDSTGKDRIQISNKYKTEHLYTSEIIYIKASGEYSEVLRSDDATFLVKKDIKYWEAELPESEFLNIHQIYLVNRDFIEALEPEEENTFCLKLKSQTKPIILNSEQAYKIKNLFN